MMILWVGVSYGQTPATKPVPEAFLLPWAMPDVDRDWRGGAADALRDSWNRLGRRVLPAGQSLKQFAAANGITQIIQGAALSERFRVGVPAAKLLQNQPEVWQPILCPVADQWILALQVSGFNDQIIYAAAHARIPRASLEEARQQNRDIGMLSDALDALAQQMATSLRSQEEAKDALKIGFSLAPSSMPLGAGSAMCLSVLLSHDIYRTHRVVRMIGGNEVVHARDVLSMKNQEERATRRAVLFWEAKQAQRLPMELRLTVRYAESVFANSMERGEAAAITLHPDLNLVAHNELKGLMQRESSALQLADMPQIAKVDRAWVYLDRGRAWGLKMNDRLVHRMGNGEFIKGHVVAFYGPNLKIQSPRGFPVSEGAIVFVRKGQGETRLGQTFAFDPTAYPTPWPPQKTP